MKIKLTALFLLFTMLSATCKKDKQDSESLPAATQTGRNTFGCLIDGKVFLVRKAGVSDFSVFQGAYDYRDGGYYFSLFAPRSKNGLRSALYLRTNDLALKEGGVYKLTSAELPNSASGMFIVHTTEFEKKTYHTSSSLSGEMLITKLEKNITSGTFSFDAVSEDGTKVEVRDGRFDLGL